MFQYILLFDCFFMKWPMCNDAIFKEPLHFTCPFEQQKNEVKSIQIKTITQPQV